MSEAVEARGRRAPFLWASSAAFRRLVSEVPARQRSSVGWVYTCLAATASESFDGSHQGFASTADEVMVLTGLSRPTFRNAIKTLEGLGLLYREDRHNETGATVGVRYVLLEPGQGGQASCLGGGQVTGQGIYPPNARPRNVKKEEVKPPYIPPAKNPKSTEDNAPQSPEVVAEFEAWLEHHRSVTGLRSPGARTKARQEFLRSYAARRAEGYSAQDMRLATVGAHADDFRREHGYDGVASVLRPTKIAGLVAVGERVEREKRSCADPFEERARRSDEKFRRSQEGAEERTSGALAVLRQQMRNGGQVGVGAPA